MTFEIAHDYTGCCFLYDRLHRLRQFHRQRLCFGRDYLIDEWKSGDCHFGGWDSDCYVMVK